MNISTRPYESLLPFMVVEAISAPSTSLDSVSFRINESGWAWLVSGKRLIVWKPTQSQTVTRRRKISPCYDLKLPLSDIAHKAELVQVFFKPQNVGTVPAALIISPEGTIRFWANIADDRFIDSSVSDAQGQEFCTLATLSPVEYIIGTTTGLVYMLTINLQASDKRGVLICSPLSVPSGLLSGIGRRVTTLFFGPMADFGPDAKGPLIAVPKYSQSTIDKTGSTDRPFFILSPSFKLRQWSRANDCTDQLVREWDLHKNVHMKLLASLGLSERDNLNSWPIDMITTRSKELLILIVVLDTLRDNSISYATCTFNPYQIGDQISRLKLLQSHSWHYSNESEDQLLSLRFLERRAASQLCFMYDRKFLFLVQVDEDILDAVDYGNQEDAILGAGVIDGHPLLFTQRDGLIYVSPVVSNKSRMNETSIQLEHPPIDPRITHRKQVANAVEPMVVELEEENSPPEEPSSRHNRSQANQSGVKSTSLNQSTISDTASEQPTSSRIATDLDDVIRNNKDFEWVHQIDNREYGLASETLANLAETSELLKDRKKTLLALSKLAKLAE